MGTIPDLANIVNDCCSYFQHKHPSSDTLDEWFKHLSHYNLGATRTHIVNHITNGEIFPRNFPAAVKSAYSSWVKSQPRETSIPEGCRYCFNGVIHAVKDNMVYAFKCAHCHTSSAYYPDSTRLSLKEKGYELDWQHEYQGVATKPDFDKFIRKFGNIEDEIPF